MDLSPNSKNKIQEDQFQRSMSKGPMALQQYSGDFRYN